MWTLASFHVGAKVVHAQAFDAGEVLPLLRRYRPTVMAMIPAALTALVRDHGVTKEDFSSLRICRCGADKVSGELESEFSRLVGFLIDEGYGMTEVGLATLNPPYGRIQAGSIGVCVPGVEIALRGDDDAIEVAAGEVGKIWIKTPSRTVGYWGNPDATAEIMRDGWLDSGDLAHADDDGYLWFFGRKKQIMVHDGSNISPFEVEGALAEHPAVALVGVIGIRDEVHGENVRAYVTIADDASRPTAQELIDFARERVGYKAPEEVVFLDEMPLNPTGKLDRVGLKRMAEAHLNSEDLHRSIATIAIS
jgi:acyl-coenzyme A synthetase/AMP-(fatty) acid ligase